MNVEQPVSGPVKYATTHFDIETFDESTESKACCSFDSRFRPLSVDIFDFE